MLSEHQLITLVDEEMEQEDDDQFAGISGMHDKISNLELEEKEIEIAELQLEIEKLKAIVNSYKEKNQSLKESNRLLSQENARLQAIVTQSKMLGCSNLHAVICFHFCMFIFNCNCVPLLVIYRHLFPILEQLQKG